MKTNQKNRARLSIEALEHRDAPAALAISPSGYVDPPPAPIGLGTAEVHRGVVLWAPAGTRGGGNESATAPAGNRPFHLKDSGAAVFNPDGTISAAASGQATHLGAFTLHDTSMIVGFEDGVLSITGEAHLQAANGDYLCASFTGSVNFATGEGTLTFEWIAGTGRFTGVTGTTQWQINLNTADLTYTAVADGVINY